MKSIFVYLFVLSFLLGCKSYQYFDATILVDSSIDVTHRIDYKSFIQSLDSVMLEKTKIPLSMVVKACMNDSLMFLLDDRKTISVYNINNGHVIKQIQKNGHGVVVYVGPKSITIDDSCLYVLDMPNLLISKYDYSLNYLGIIKIQVPSFDFISIKDGFLMWNLNVSEQMKKMLKFHLKEYL